MTEDFDEDAYANHPTEPPEYGLTDEKFRAETSLTALIEAADTAVSGVDRGIRTFFQKIRSERRAMLATVYAAAAALVSDQAALDQFLSRRKVRPAPQARSRFQPIVSAFFGETSEELKSRVSKYSAVLEIAFNASVAPAQFAAWLDAGGGIEGIYNATRNAGRRANARPDEEVAAKRQCSAIVRKFLSRHEAENPYVEACPATRGAGNEHNTLRLLVCRIDEQGQFKPLLVLQDDHASIERRLARLIPR